ncbi:MAG: ABC transporter ATP-binding protein [Candidatus Thorarchaeota archaeon]
MLEGRNICFSYDGATQILDDIQLDLKPGELIVITGPTGSGKSTLAKYLAGFIPRTIRGTLSGRLSIDGTDTSTLSMPEFARKVALVQQDVESQLCTLRVADEIAFGPENFMVEQDMIQEIVTTSLNSVGADHLANRPTHALSGGEKQRIVIAAMLACRPDYLILDEPTASLDPKGVQLLSKILLSLKERGLGIICIEHRLTSILPIADRVLRITDGRISPYDINEAQQENWSDGTHYQGIIGSPILSADSVKFTYSGSDDWAVKNTSLTCHQGEIIALMGDNGSGKSTLIGLLGGLFRPSHGQIFLEDIPIDTISKEQIASEVALVFQNPNHQIFERTVWAEQNLILSVLGINDEANTVKSEKTLKTANLFDQKDNNPFSLSHGQKRRLNVCSVTVHNPNILLFDEPFIGQDTRGRRFITQKINDIAQKGGMVIVVTHDTSYALNHCSRLVFMDRGTVLLDGSPQTVLDRLDAMGRHEYKDSSRED